MAKKALSIKSMRKLDQFKSSKTMSIEEELPVLNEHLEDGWIIQDTIVATPPNADIHDHVIFLLHKDD